MLRSRKKDVRIKPNRKLDKRSSRGMLYENEELRLRTIEINAEVERGQTDIKKLRRENDHLRREMWALRDEYERLENLIKHLDLAGTSTQSGGSHGNEGSDRDSPSEDDAGGSGRQRRRSSGLSLNDESTTSTLAASSSVQRCHRCVSVQDNVDGQAVALYVECGSNNPDMDNIENYQKAYGRMPRRCSSAGARVYGDVCAASLHHLHHMPPPSGHPPPPPRPESAELRSSCYESVTNMVVLVDGLTPAPTCGELEPGACLPAAGLVEEAGDELDPPYASPAGPHMAVSRYFLPVTASTSCTSAALASAVTAASAAAAGGWTASCPSSAVSHGLAPPQEPPPLPPVTGRLIRSAPLMVSESIDHQAAPETPSEDGHFNLDHLVSIVRTFQEEQQLHNQQQQQQPPMDRSAETPVESSDVIVQVPTPSPSSSDEDSVRSASTCRVIERRRRPSASSTASMEVSSLPPAAVPVAVAAAVAAVAVAAAASNGGVNGAVASTAAAKSTEQSVTFTQSRNNQNGVTKQSVTFRQNSIVFVNSTPPTPPPPPPPLPAAGSSSSGRVVKFNAIESVGATSAVDCRNPAIGGPADDDGDSLSLVATARTDGRSLLRFHSVEPNTVCFDMSRHGLSARRLGVQDIIDELDRQLDAQLCVVRGVRIVGSVVYISLDKRQSLSYLMKKTLNVCGVAVHLIDVSRNTLIVVLVGVPHYISDLTVSMLLAAFGTVIGDLERRFYKGVDTGERLVRLKVKANVKMPRHITVGGCRIQLRVLPLGDDPLTSSLTASSSTPDVTDLTDFMEGPPAAMTATAATAAPLVTTPCATPEPGHPAGSSAEPRIGKSFEYRSQLSVNLRMSAEIPNTLISEADAADCGRTPVRTPSMCPVCDTHPLSSASCNAVRSLSNRQTPPPPPMSSSSSRNLHDMTCSHHHHHHHHPVQPHQHHHRCGSTPTVSETTGRGGCFRESPPKSRASVNFEESTSVLSSKSAKTGGLKSSGSTGAASGGVTGTGGATSSNGILRKSVSGDTDTNTAGAEDDSMTTISDAAGKGKSGAAHRPLFVKKTARSFSLVDTFRARNLRKSTSAAAAAAAAASGASGAASADVSADEPATTSRHTSVSRRDSVKSTESGSRSSRSSRKSGDLPWCGCWGNGCL